MSLDTFMREALHRATQMIRTEGSVRPTFFIASTEGIYTLAVASDGVFGLDDIALQVVSAAMRWSMAQAFIVTCEHRSPSRLAVYVVTANGVQGISSTIRKRPLRIDHPKLVAPPADILQLRALIPQRVSQLSQEEIANLVEALGLELQDCHPDYFN